MNMNGVHAVPEEERDSKMSALLNDEGNDTSDYETANADKYMYAAMPETRNRASHGQVSAVGKRHDPTPLNDREILHLMIDKMFSNGDSIIDLQRSTGR